MHPHPLEQLLAADVLVLTGRVLLPRQLHRRVEGVEEELVGLQPVAAIRLGDVEEGVHQGRPIEARARSTSASGDRFRFRSSRAESQPSAADTTTIAAPSERSRRDATRHGAVGQLRGVPARGGALHVRQDVEAEVEDRPRAGAALRGRGLARKSPSRSNSSAATSARLRSPQNTAPISACIRGAERAWSRRASPRRAPGEPHESVQLLPVPAGPEDLPVEQDLRAGIGPGRVEADGHHAAANRRQQRTRGRALQEDVNAGTGLLKGLREGVLRLLEHRLRLAHDDELPAPFRCSEGEEGLHGRALVGLPRTRFPRRDEVHRDRVLTVRLMVDHEDVRVGPSQHPQARAALEAGRRSAFVAQQGRRQPERGAELADPLLPREQERVGQGALTRRRREPGDDLLVSARAHERRRRRPLRHVAPPRAEPRRGRGARPRPRPRFRPR